jgi:hypothetical protein
VGGLLVFRPACHAGVGAELWTPSAAVETAGQSGWLDCNHMLASQAGSGCNAADPRSASASLIRPRHFSASAQRLALLDHLYRLAGHPSEGLNFSLHGERLGCEFPVLHGVPIATRSPAPRAMHPADLRPPHGRRTALEPAPLRFGVASQCLVHRQVHGVDLQLFSAPLPPRPEH